MGVSRAALEAMACGLPVILLGNEGYLGLLDEERLAAARECNFTARGSKIAFGDLGDALFCDICRYFELNDEEKLRLSALSRREVEMNYSAEKMARMTLGLYEKVLTDMQIKSATKICVTHETRMIRQKPFKIMIFTHIVEIFFIAYDIGHTDQIQP